MNIEDFEIILINSNSPIKEVEYYDKFSNECHKLNIFKIKRKRNYSKTWNRGIKIRGKYLVFLGIDETFKVTLKTLSNYLDEILKLTGDEIH